MTPTAAFVIAALQASIGIWGFAIPKTGCAVRGLAFAALGTYRMWRRSRRHD